MSGSAALLGALLAAGAWAVHAPANAQARAAPSQDGMEGPAQRAPEIRVPRSSAPRAAPSQDSQERARPQPQPRVEAPRPSYRPPRAEPSQDSMERSRPQPRIEVPRSNFSGPRAEPSQDSMERSRPQPRIEVPRSGFSGPRAEPSQDSQERRRDYPVRSAPPPNPRPPEGGPGRPDRPGPDHGRPGRPDWDRDRPGRPDWDRNDRGPRYGWDRDRPHSYRGPPPRAGYYGPGDYYYSPGYYGPGYRPVPARPLPPPRIRGGDYYIYLNRQPFLVPAPRIRYYQEYAIVRPYGGWYAGYGRYRSDADAWQWLGFTAITLTILELLDEGQQRTLEDAQIQAATAPVGGRVDWDDRGARGSVRVVNEWGDAYQRLCRDFEQVVTVGNRTERAFGTACQNPDGAWTVITPA